MYLARLLTNAAAAAAAAAAAGSRSEKILHKSEPSYFSAASSMRS